jgi:hypothetical protein
LQVAAGVYKKKRDDIQKNEEMFFCHKSLCGENKRGRGSDQKDPSSSQTSWMDAAPAIFCCGLAGLRVFASNEVDQKLHRPNGRRTGLERPLGISNACRILEIRNGFELCKAQKASIKGWEKMRKSSWITRMHEERQKAFPLTSFFRSKQAIFSKKCFPKIQFLSGGDFEAGPFEWSNPVNLSA